MTQIGFVLKRRRGAWLAGALLTVALLGLTLSAHAAGVSFFQEDARFEVRFGSHDGETTLGTGFRLFDGWWVLANLDRLGEDSPRTSASVVFEVPKKFLMFTVYGGPGVHVGSASDDFTAHVLGGARFWVLYWENEYPLASGETTYHRAGFRLDF
ncbi:MAG: hypothetical protein ACM3RP_10655 [Chitinophagales bacterium]